MNDRKPTKFTVFQKNQADSFFVLAFQAVDLASTEHCSNSQHLLFFTPRSTNCIDMRPGAESPTEVITEWEKVGHVRSRQ